MLVYRALNGYAAQAHKMLQTCIYNQTLNYKESSALLSPPHAYIKDYFGFYFFGHLGDYILFLNIIPSKSLPE